MHCSIFTMKLYATASYTFGEKKMDGYKASTKAYASKKLNQ